MTEAIIHGIILAFGLILPLGVQNVFIFNVGARSPSFIKAVPVILTASICDTLLILTAVLGVSLILFSMAWLKSILLAAGVLFLLYMGWVVWNSRPAQDNMGAAVLSTKRQILFAASVSLLNPHAILDTIGVIGTSALTYNGEEKWAFTTAAIIISWLWFFGLALAGRWTGKLDSSGSLIHFMNKLSAIIIWGIAIYLLTKLF